MTAPAEAPAASADSPKRSRLYFGWYIVAGAFLAQMLQAGLSVYAGGVFLVPMTEDLGWSRTEFTLAQTVGQLVTGAIGFFIGAHVDRRGGRGVMLVGGVFVASTMFAIGHIDEWWQWLVLRGLLFMAGSAMIGSLVVNVTLSKWFVDLRGRAIGAAAVGFSIGGIVIAPPLTAIVDEFGWRAGWQVLGVLVVIIIFPVALLFRRQPEDHGLNPDGRNADEMRLGARSRIDADYRNSYTRREALRTPALYMITFAFGLAVIGIGGVILNTIPFLTDQDYSRATAARIVVFLGLASGFSKPFWGWMTEHYDARYVAAFGFALSGSAMVFVVFAAASGSAPLVALAYVFWGLGVGALFPTQEVIWAQYFGRRYLGEVRSVVLPISLGMGAAGPLITALYFDAVGDYDGVFLAVGINWVFASILILAVRRPGPPPGIAIASPAAPRA